MSKSESSFLQNHLKKSLQRHFDTKTPSFILGVSGGLDSMALMYLMKECHQDVIVVHINYGLRGEESDLDQELVEQMSSEFGFDCAAFKLKYSEQKDGNMQAWARDQRYSIFEEMKRELNADVIVTAHHQDDQVETILQKMFRGSAPDKWTGMSELNEHLYRPLIRIKRSELEAYAEEKAIPYREDTSNKESKYARNFIRLIMDEKLQSLFPGWKDNVLKLQDFGQTNLKLTEAILDKVKIDEESISTERLTDWDTEIQKIVLKKFIEQETFVHLSKGKIQELAKWESWQTGSQFEINKHWSLHLDRAALMLVQKTEALEIEVEKERLNSGLTIEDFYFEVREAKEEDWTLNLDANKLNFPITIRHWQDGDRIKPFGMEGTKKVADLLTDRKVSSALKEKSLVLTGSGGTIYAILFPETLEDGSIGNISNDVRFDNRTAQFLAIKKL